MKNRSMKSGRLVKSLRERKRFGSRIHKLRSGTNKHSISTIPDAVVVDDSGKSCAVIPYKGKLLSKEKLWKGVNLVVPFRRGWTGDTLNDD